MAEKTPQNLDNHGRMVPGYHYVATSFLMFFLVWSIARMVAAPSLDTAALLSAAIGLLLVGWYARAFPNRNQDRIIRLEERLRMQEILPAELRPRIREFTTEQLVALRFASDAELPELARRVLEEGITDRKAIKGLVKDWRADYQRV